MTFALALAPVLAVVVALFLAGCSSSTPATPGSTSGSPTADATASGGTGGATPGATTAGTGGGTGGGGTGNAGTPKLSAVTVARTGGIAGVVQQVTIAADGSWTYTDKKSGATQKGHLSAAESAQIAALLTNPSLMLEARATGAPVACSDSFVYTIGMGEASMRYDQCSAKGKRPLTDQLISAVVGATPL